MINSHHINSQNLRIREINQEILNRYEKLNDRRYGAARKAQFKAEIQALREENIAIQSR